MRFSNAAGLRYPASEYRLETSTISPLSEESDRQDAPFERHQFQLDMFHEQLPLPVPCYDLLPVTKLTVGPLGETSGTPGSLELTGGEYKT